MGRGFDKLRIALAAGTVSAALMAGSAGTRRARAATVALPQVISAGGAVWTVGSGSSGPFGTVGLAVQEASLPGPVLNDAYDGAFMLAVNGIIFADPTGNVDLTGTTLTSNVRNMSGLDVQVEYFFHPSLPVVRALYSLTNSTSSKIEATVTVGADLGSDDDTVIEATSNSNTTLEFGDSWLVTSDQAPLSDPVLTFFRANIKKAKLKKKGTPLMASAPGVSGGGNSDAYQDVYLIKVRRNKTVRILLFGRLSETVQGAIDTAPTFDDRDELANLGLLDGLSKQQLKEIINYKGLKKAL